MDLVVDIGNTRTKIAFFNADGFVEVASIQGEGDARVDELMKQHRPINAIVASVAGNAEKWLLKYPNLQWLLLQPNTKVPFANLYKSPLTLGLDRIALAAAAQKIFPHQNTLVIDAGTCVTYDFVNAAGEYLGGGISPGLQMRLKAMNAFTAKLPLADVNPDVQLIGDSTLSSLQSGALQGLAAEIEGTILRYEEQFENLQVVLTGGDTKVLVPLVKNGIFARQNFLLEGLHAILAYNTL